MAKSTKPEGLSSPVSFLQVRSHVGLVLVEDRHGMHGTAAKLRDWGSDRYVFRTESAQLKGSGRAPETRWCCGGALMDDSSVRSL